MYFDFENDNMFPEYQAGKIKFSRYTCIKIGNQSCFRGEKQYYFI